MFKIDYYLALHLKIVILGTYIILNWKDKTQIKMERKKSYVFSHYKKRSRRLNKLISEE